VHITHADLLDYLFDEFDLDWVVIRSQATSSSLSLSRAIHPPGRKLLLNVGSPGHQRRVSYSNRHLRDTSNTDRSSHICYLHSAEEEGR